MMKVLFNNMEDFKKMSEEAKLAKFEAKRLEHEEESKVKAKKTKKTEKTTGGWWWWWIV